MRKIEKWIEVEAPLPLVFDLFSRYERCPEWMEGLLEVRRIDGRRVHWVAKGHGGSTTLKWQTETTSFEPERRIAWRSVEGDLHQDVEAEFEETRKGTTLLRLVMNEDSPHEGVGSSDLSHNFPAEAQRLEQNLGRFKLLAEGFAAHRRDEKKSRSAAQTLVHEGRREERSRENIGAMAEPAVEAPGRSPFSRTGEVPHREAATPSLLEKKITTSAGRRRSSSNAYLPYVMIAVAAFALVMGTLLWLAAQRRAAERLGTVGLSGDATPIAAGERATVEPAPRATETPESEISPTRGKTGMAEETKRTAPEKDGEAELRDALGAWVKATNESDLNRQLQFYAPRLERYYLQSNFSREAVRRDKEKLFERARLVNVQVSDLRTDLGRDGRTAVTRFRKRYRIERSRLTEGEVLQELKWVREGDAWKITSERDLRVIR